MVAIGEGLMQGNADERMREAAEATQKSDNLGVQAIGAAGAGLGQLYGENDGNLLGMGQVVNLAT
jgi:hypothetical protein